MKLVQFVSAALLLSVLFVAISGCEKEGPAEKAGQSIDNIVKKAGDKIEEVKDSIKQKAEK